MVMTVSVSSVLLWVYGLGALEVTEITRLFQASLVRNVGMWPIPLRPSVLWRGPQWTSAAGTNTQQATRPRANSGFMSNNQTQSLRTWVWTTHMKGVWSTWGITATTHWDWEIWLTKTLGNTALGLRRIKDRNSSENLESRFQSQVIYKVYLITFQNEPFRLYWLIDCIEQQSKFQSQVAFSLQLVYIYQARLGNSQIIQIDSYFPRPASACDPSCSDRGRESDTNLQHHLHSE